MKTIIKTFLLSLAILPGAVSCISLDTPPYDRETDRTIKARLNNLEHIQLLGPAGVSEEAIRQAMDRLLAAMKEKFPETVQ